MFKLRTVILLVLVMMIGFQNMAHAYINPGSGAILLQVILAFTAGGFVVFRNSISNFIKKIFGKKPSNQE